MTGIVDIAQEGGESALRQAAEVYRAARRPVALTGAGVSVESGIPDFRSPGGLWDVYPAEEYASIETFLENPDKAWVLFRAMGEVVVPARPNPAHEALARLEAEAGLAGVVTQNIDGLHQKAGSRTVLEIHGDYRRLACLRCRILVDADESLLEGDTPLCGQCHGPLKPNVVLFGEAVHGAVEIQQLMEGCDLLLSVGTSALVYPAASLPWMVRRSGGALFEFNLEPTPLTATDVFPRDRLFRGRAGETLPAFVRALLDEA